MKVACILADAFEDSEFKVPYDRLLQAGLEVVVIGTKGGQELVGVHNNVRVKVDCGIDSVHPEEFDALLIPGGYSPDKLRADDRFVAFVREMVHANKLVAAVCHGPQILITANAVRGRTMTAWKTVQVDLRNAGANVVDREVVVDRNFITSRKPEDLDVFSREMLRYLGDAIGMRAEAPPLG